MASLSHTVIFHTDRDELSMVDSKNGQPYWFCQEAWAGGARHGRGLHESRMWRDDGLHVASSIQDGMVRLKVSGSENGLMPSQPVLTTRKREDGQSKKGFSPEGMAKDLEAMKGSKL